MIVNKLKISIVKNTIVPINRNFNYDAINSKFPNLTNVNTTQFPSLFSIPIQWGYQDTTSFVNNTHLFRMFESGRNDYRRLLSLFMDLEIFENMENGKLPGLILKSQLAEFFTNVKYPDRIDIATRVIDIKEDRLSYNTVLFSRDLSDPICQCISTCVSYDHSLHKKVNLLNEFKLGIEKMEANPSRTQLLANSLELRKFNTK